MKVYIGPYKNWFGPYQLVDKIFFWQEQFPEDENLEKRWDYRFRKSLADFLARGFKEYPHETWFHKIFTWIDSKKKRKVKIRIDPYDTWNFDSTLAPIILPMLKQLKATKHGSGYIDLEDVPERLRYTETEDYESQMVFDFYNDDSLPKDKFCDVHTRYDWALNEMIWAFEQLQPDADWEKQYWKVEPELDFEKYPEDEGQSTVPVRWKNPGVCDWEGRRKHQERIDNGLRLFGKYFQTLWD